MKNTYIWTDLKSCREIYVHTFIILTRLSPQPIDPLILSMVKPTPERTRMGGGWTQTHLRNPTTSLSPHTWRLPRCLLRGCCHQFNQKPPGTGGLVITHPVGVAHLLHLRIWVEVCVWGRNSGVSLYKEGKQWKVGRGGKEKRGITKRGFGILFVCIKRLDWFHRKG